ncbi:TNNC1, partial [Symbiodinium sp. KB8]
MCHTETFPRLIAVGNASQMALEEHGLEPPGLRSASMRPGSSQSETVPTSPRAFSKGGSPKRALTTSRFDEWSKKQEVKKTEQAKEYEEECRKMERATESISALKTSTLLNDKNVAAEVMHKKAVHDLNDIRRIFSHFDQASLIRLTEMAPALSSRQQPAIKGSGDWLYTPGGVLWMSDQAAVDELVLRLGDLTITINRPARARAERETEAAGEEALPDRLVARDTEVLAAGTAAELARLHLPALQPLADQLRGATGEGTPQARVARAYRAGLSAAGILRGEIGLAVRSPSIPQRNTIYIVLQCALHEDGFWTTSFATFRRYTQDASDTFNQAEVEGLASALGAQRPLPPLHLVLDADEGVSRLAQGHLLRVRPGGFLVVLPNVDLVLQGLRSLLNDEGEGLTLDFATNVELETSRGRALGLCEVLLVDVFWEAVGAFTKAYLLRGALARETRLIPFEAGGSTGRPQSLGALAAADAWIMDTMEADTAAEYTTAEEPAQEEAADPGGVDGLPASNQEVVSALLERMQRLEVRLAEGQPAASSAPVLLRPPVPGALGPAALERLQTLAGPAPRRMPGAPTSKAAPAQRNPRAGDTAYRESELEVVEPAEVADPFVELKPQDPLQQILAAQLAQNQLLLERLAPTRPVDAVAAALGGGGSGSASDSGGGIKGCLARDAFLKQIEDLPRVAEEPNLLKQYMERRLPLSGHRLLSYMASFAAEGWETGARSRNIELQGYAARLMIFCEQASLDAGRLQLAWLLTGYPEPAASSTSTARRSTLKPFTALGHPSWVAGNVAYLRDLDYIESRMSALNKPRGNDKADKDEPLDEKKGRVGQPDSRPEFNPLPFISSPALRAAYQDPELLRRPRADWEVNRPALIHADKPELLALARTWDQFGALKIFGASEIEGLDPAEEVAQSSHEGLLQQLCGSMLEHEVLKYRSPLPREGVLFDFFELGHGSSPEAPDALTALHTCMARRVAFILCSPSCETVFGCCPELGQSVSEFSEKVPLSLARRLAAGSLANKHGATRHIDFQHRAATARTLSLPSPFAFTGLRDTEPYPDRDWHEDPEWIGEICSSLPFRELFRYRFARPGHINVNEAAQVSLESVLLDNRVDKKWQQVEPGECRAVLPAAAVRAALCLGSLWGWFGWVGLVLLGFLAMLHPAEMVSLTRRDLVFPRDNLGHVSALFIFLRNPKTARFARRQHGKIDDPNAIAYLDKLFGSLQLEDRLFPASMHTFRRLWDAIMQRLGIPCRAALRGATPGVLRGSGATFFYQQTENVPLLAWRGRWARQKTLEYYLQEVAAQMLLGELTPAARARILLLDEHCEFIPLLAKLLRRPAEDLDRGEVWAVWDQVDADGSGSIDFDEFQKWYAELMGIDILDYGQNFIPDDISEDQKMVRSVAKSLGRTILEVEKLYDEFRKLDADNSNTLERDEFKVLIQRHFAPKGPEVPEHVFKMFWKDFDKDGKGSVTFIGFVKWYLKFMKGDQDPMQ